MKEKLLKELKECLENVIEFYPFSGTYDYAKSGCRTFSVIVNNKYFEVCCNIKLDDAKYILENLDKVNYILNESDDIDSVIGDICPILKKYRITDARYVNYVIDNGYEFTEKDIYEFMEKEGF